MDKSAEGQIH